MGVFLRITLPRIGLLVSLGLLPDPLRLVCVGWLALARGAVAAEWAPEGVHPALPFLTPIAVLRWGVGENKGKKKREKTEKANQEAGTLNKTAMSLLPVRRARGVAATRDGARGGGSSGSLPAAADGARRRVVRGSWKKVPRRRQPGMEKWGGAGRTARGQGGTAWGWWVQRGDGRHREGVRGTARGRGAYGVWGREEEKRGGGGGEKTVRCPRGTRERGTDGQAACRFPSGQRCQSGRNIRAVGRRPWPPLYSRARQRIGALPATGKGNKNEKAGGGTFCRCTDESASPPRRPQGEPMAAAFHPWGVANRGPVSLQGAPFEWGDRQPAGFFFSFFPPPLTQNWSSRHELAPPPLLPAPVPLPRLSFVVAAACADGGGDAAQHRRRAG